MRLLRCHIENFGKLRDFHVDFAENPTVINEKNGWGKSTLAVFIKVMFYGFANEKKRGDALERERVRFRPWQGGVCGGELVFEADGRQYLLNRTFGAKEADDTFALYDAATNLLSDDFSTNIGEELFQINQESFLRTIYIAQNDCVTQTTDSINAKMGNLADNLDDINNYEKVQQVLKDLRNSLTPARKTGELRRLKEEIDDLKNELRKRELIEGAVRELEAKLEDCGREKEETLREQKDLQEELLVLSRRKEIAAKREHYERILRQCEERRRAAVSGEQFFGGNIPEREQLRQMLEKRSRMVQRESEQQANRLSGEEETKLAEYKKMFLAGMPGEEVFARGRELSDQLDSLQKKAAGQRFSAEEEQEAGELKRRLGGRNIREEDLDYHLQQWALYNEIKSGLSMKRATLSSLKIVENGNAAQTDRRGRGIGILGLLIPLGLMLAGAALYFLEPLTGLALLAAGGAMAAVCLILQMTTGKKKRLQKDDEVESGSAVLEREIAADEKEMERAREEVLRFLDGFGGNAAEEGRSIQDVLYGLKNDLRRLRRFQARELDYQGFGYEEKTAKIKGDFQMLLQPYYSLNEIREKSAGELLADLDNCRRAFGQISARQERYLRAKEEYTALKADIRAFLADYGQEDTADMDAALRQMEQRLAAYESDLTELEKCLAERADFERNYDIHNFEEEPSGEFRETEEVKAQLESVAERLERISANRNSYLAQLDDRQREAEQLELAEQTLEQLSEQYEEKYRYYCNLERTSEYLARAKESFSARYMGPIMGAFQRNFEKLSRISGEDFRMDANIRITRREAGEQRDTRAFSAGSQDLIGICLRMALIEAMYQKERPFLIFDDSFVNLDDEKLSCAKEFLRGVAEKYQVIYFTCHESRSL